jgi:hypothetical protein
MAARHGYCLLLTDTSLDRRNGGFRVCGFNGLRRGLQRGFVTPGPEASFSTSQMLPLLTLMIWSLAHPSPDPLHPVLADRPSRPWQQHGDPPITLPPVLARQRDDCPCQGILIAAQNRSIPLCASPLPQQPAGMPLGESVLFPCMLYRTTPPLRA